MDINTGGAVIAGLVATGAMTMVLYAGIGMMPKQMTMNFLYMKGTMAVTDRTQAYLLGAMMSVIFALIHVGLY
jgi:hypothetical protein